MCLYPYPTQHGLLNCLGGGSESLCLCGFASPLTPTHTPHINEAIGRAAGIAPHNRPHFTEQRPGYTKSQKHLQTLYNLPHKRPPHNQEEILKKKRPVLTEPQQHEQDT